MQPWLVVLVLMTLSGCASMSKQECLDAAATSWEGVGYEDGYNGYDPGLRLSQHDEACREVGVFPHRETFMMGWSRGIREYCTPQRGYQVGLSGSSGNPELCPDDTGILFQENAELGQRIYGLKREMDSVYSEIKDLEKRLDNAQLDKHERRAIRDRIRHRDDEMSHLRWRLIEAEAAPLIQF